MKKTALSKKFKVALVLLVLSSILCSCAEKSMGNLQASGIVYESVAEKSYDVYSSANINGGFVDFGFASNEMMSAPEEGYITEEAESGSMGWEVPGQVSDKEVVKEESRKIIYKSYYDFETKEFDKSVETLEVLCDRFGAYFESANIYSSGGSSRSAKFTVRVPVSNYKAFTDEANTVGVVIRVTQDNKDVTEQYFDTEARLESAKIREERVLEILKNSSDLDDVLALERELSDIRYEIESYSGTLRKYDSLISYATVTINISEVYEYVEPKVQVVTFGERIDRSFDDGIAEFKSGWENFLVKVSYNFIPIIIWIVVIIVLIVVIKAIVRKIKKAVKKLNAGNTYTDNTAEASDKCGEPASEAVENKEEKK